MLIAEELALVAMNPLGKGPGLGMRRPLNACLAGLLLGDLVLEGVAALHPKDTIVMVPGASLDEGMLTGAAYVVAGKGPKIKAVLSDMDRGLRKYAGQGRSMFTSRCVLIGICLSLRTACSRSWQYSS